jgi:hypothetical protein
MNDKIEYLLNDGRQIMLKYLPPSSCVSSTRLSIEFLKEYGFSCRPQPVHLLSIRSGDVRFVGRLPGATVPEGNWNGHLVTIIDGTYLLDMSLDQIGLPPSVFSISEFPVICELSGHMLFYFTDSDESFRHTSGWKTLWKEPLKELRGTIESDG